MAIVIPCIAFEARRNATKREDEITFRARAQRGLNLIARDTRNENLKVSKVFRIHRRRSADNSREEMIQRNDSESRKRKRATECRSLTYQLSFSSVIHSSDGGRRDHRAFELFHRYPRNGPRLKRISKRIVSSRSLSPSSIAIPKALRRDETTMRIHSKLAPN